MLANALQIRAVYIFDKRNKLKIPVIVSLSKGTIETLALVDSSAMENFINHKTAKRLKLGAEKLDDPIWLRNMDGTYN